MFYNLHMVILFYFCFAVNSMLVCLTKLDNITHLYYVNYLEYISLNISILYTYNLYIFIIIYIFFFNYYYFFFSLHCHFVLYFKFLNKGFVCFFFFFFFFNINFYCFVLLTHFFQWCPKFNVRNKIEKITFFIIIFCII